MSENPGLGHNNPPPPSRDERFASLAADVETIAARGTELPTAIEDDDVLSAVVEVVKASKKLATRIDDTRKDENRPLNDEVKANNAWFGNLSDRLDRMNRVLETRAGDYNREKRRIEQERLRKEAEERAEQERIERERQERERAEQGEKTGIDAEIEADRLERLRNDRMAAETRAVREAGPTRTSAGTVGTRKGFDFRVLNYAAIDLTELKESIGVDAIDKAIRDHIRRHKDTRPLKGVEIFESTKTNIR